MVEQKMSAFVGEFQLDADFLDLMERSNADTMSVQAPAIGECALTISELVTGPEATALNDILSEQEWVPVGIHGMMRGYDPAVDPLGSYRVTTYNEIMAQTLWDRVKDGLPESRTMNTMTPTDWDGSREWRPVGVNPLMRFIKYHPGGLLLPHYDAPHIHDENKRTLMSLVVYLDKSDGILGGATRFLHDPQGHIPVSERPNLDDWQRMATPDEVRLEFNGSRGKAIAFDHRLLHDSEPVSGQGQKLLLRTDIEFERDT